MSPANESLPVLPHIKHTDTVGMHDNCIWKVPEAAELSTLVSVCDFPLFFQHKAIPYLNIGHDCLLSVLCELLYPVFFKSHSVLNNCCS